MFVTFEKGGRNCLEHYSNHCEENRASSFATSNDSQYDPTDNAIQIRRPKNVALKESGFFPMQILRNNRAHNENNCDSLGCYSDTTRVALAQAEARMMMADSDCARAVIEQAEARMALSKEELEWTNWCSSPIPYRSFEAPDHDQSSRAFRRPDKVFIQALCESLRASRADAARLTELETHRSAQCASRVRCDRWIPYGGRRLGDRMRRGSRKMP
jgi:hypothetical protein